MFGNHDDKPDTGVYGLKSSFLNHWWGYKEHRSLRTLLGDPVVGPFNLSYCGAGALAACRDSLWQAIHQAADVTAVQLGQPDPALWRKAAARTGFVPGLLPNTFPSTNRPTFQQVLEFEH